MTVTFRTNTNRSKDSIHSFGYLQAESNDYYTGVGWGMQQNTTLLTFGIQISQLGESMALDRIIMKKLSSLKGLHPNCT